MFKILSVTHFVWVGKLVFHIKVRTNNTVTESVT